MFLVCVCVALCICIYLSSLLIGIHFNLHSLIANIGLAVETRLTTLLYPQLTVYATFHQTLEYTLGPVITYLIWKVDHTRKRANHVTWSLILTITTTRRQNVREVLRIIVLYGLSTSARREESTFTTKRKTNLSGKNQVETLKSVYFSLIIGRAHLIKSW